MKYKSSFVTNSSSSSFVIALKKMPEIDSETIEKYPFIKGYVKMINEFLKADYDITNIDELNSYAKEMYWYQDSDFDISKLDDYEIARYNRYKENIENGYSIKVIDVDYNEESKSELLNSLEDGNNFILLQRGE